MKKGYYRHPINKKISTITIKDKDIIKVNQNGLILTAYGYYLSEPQILTYSIHPIFISKQQLLDYEYKKFNYSI